MRSTNQVRTYNRNESVVFSKTDEPFGGLSNMAGGFPLKVNGLRILTSEALYQACRFPHKPDVQRLIIEQASPMTAKMKSKPYRRDSRPDWDQVRVKIMRWCLRVKLVQNWEKFSKLLLATGNCPIVEQSWKDDFWGTKPVDDQTLVGMNVLGRLLMELREEVRSGGRAAFLRVDPLAIPDFLLLGQPIQPVIAEGIDQNEQDSPVQPTLFNPLDQPLQDGQRATAADLPVQATLFDLPEQAEGAEPQGSAETPRMELAHALKPYPAYKDSGVPWLGEVPAHWEVRRGKALFRCIDVRSQTGQEELLTVSSERGVVPRRSANVTMFKAESYVGYKLCWPDDLVINSLWAWARGLGVSPYHGIVSSAYGVYRLRNRQQDNPRFIHQLVRSTPFQWELQVRSKGIWVSRLQLTDDAFLGAPFPMPPSNEQTAIVRFLDYMDRRIRRYIRAKQKLIKLLEEYKQALIHQVVTGQIDVRTGQPYPAYKDSGVEWLGEVPAHWEVRRLKRIARLNPSKSEVPLAIRNDPAVFLPMERVGSDGRFDASEVHPISALWNGFTYFRRGDVIVAKITPCFENGKGACLKDLPTSVGFGSTEFHVIRPLAEVTAPYVYRVTTLSEFRRLGADEMTGAAGQQRVPAEFIANFRIPLPPLSEQTAIVEYLDAQTAKVDAAMAAACREIELLREYRERLIADVVTGKVDVREVAAQLPEELNEPELLIDADEGEGEASEMSEINGEVLEDVADE